LNEVSIENIIQMVTQEVVKQLKSSGVTITAGRTGMAVANALGDSSCRIQSKTERIDMSKFKTPVLTEKHINRLHELTGKIIIPQGTLITPKAREITKRKQIFIEIE
jgi:hypothetical protein